MLGPFLGWVTAYVVVASTLFYMIDPDAKPPPCETDSFNEWVAKRKAAR